MGLLRLILALSVLIDHTGPLFGFRLIPAQPAVLCFFILSGFYMSLVINTKYRFQKNGTLNFYFNRVLRLYPAYLFILLISLIFQYLMGLPSIFFRPAPFISVSKQLLYILVNITIIGQDVLSSFDPVFHQFTNHPVSVAWTLGTEWLFYLIAPFILIVDSRTHRKIVISLILLSISIRFLLFLFNYQFPTTNPATMDWSSAAITALLTQSDPGRYRLFPSVLVFFLLGNLAYRIYLRIQPYEISQQIGKLAILVFLSSLSAIIIFADSILFWQNENDTIPFWFLYLTIFLATPFIFTWSKNIAWDNIIGKFGYPIYICQNISVVLAFSITSDRQHILYPPVAILITISFALVLYHMVENSFSSFRK